MPRLEENNPTERIGRLLDDYEELQQYADELIELVIQSGSGAKLPSAPLGRAFIEERARRQFTLRMVQSTRKAIRRTRYRQAKGIRLRGSKPYEESMDEDILKEAGLSEETRRELEKLIDEAKDA